MYFVESEMFLINILRIVAFFHNKFGDSHVFFGYYVYWIIGNLLTIAYISSLMANTFKGFFDTPGIFSLSNNLESILIHFSIVALAIFSLLSQKKMMKFLTNLKRFESDLYMMSTASDEIISSKIKINRKRSIFAVTVLTLLMIAFSISYGAETTQFSLEKYSQNILMYLSYAVIDFYICTIAIFLVCIVESLCVYLDAIKTYIENYPTSRFSSYKNLTEIKHLMDEFSETFGVLIFYDYIFGFSAFTFEMFNNFRFTSLIGSRKIKPYRIPMILCNFVMWMSPLIIIVYFLGRGCSNIESKFHRIILSLQIKIEDNRGSSDRIIENLSLEDIPPIHAAGFFDVDKSIIFKVDYCSTKKLYCKIIIVSS